MLLVSFARLPTIFAPPARLAADYDSRQRQSGSPAAVNQLVVTQLAAPDGGTDTLAAFLLAQYIFLLRPCSLSS